MRIFVRGNIRKILLTVFLFGLFASNGFAQSKPSILFCSPQGARYGWVDLNYLQELHQKGFEVDYTRKLSDITWGRIKRYNVLVIYVTPDAFAVSFRRQKSSPEKIAEFVNLIKKYLNAGGGVFLFPSETNLGKQKVVDLTRLFGAKIPVERIVEKDKGKIAPMTHMSQYVPLAFTRNIFPSPVSQGVKQIWYPYKKGAYLSQQTAPIWVDKNWKVVVRASKTSITKPVDISRSTEVIKNPFIREQGVKEPPIFAIRDFHQGRIAFTAEWRQFSIGQGTKWSYNSEVLSKGLQGKASDFGKLLENTFRWLAAPSLRSKLVGGYVTLPGVLLPPNYRPGVRQRFAERYWKYEPEVLRSGRPLRNEKLFKGIIGIKTNYSSGTGTVKEYAVAAKKLGLNFLVFMDDYAQLTPEKFKQLKEDCQKYSDNKIRLFAGFSIKNNIGNHMFFFSPHPVLPPAKVFTGKNKKILYIQQEDGKGNYTGYLTPFLNWVLANYGPPKGNVGYYDFSGSGKGMRMPDLRLYAMVGIRYYQGGKLVEDVTPDYLTTAQSTISPAPVSINEVHSPRELIREVTDHHSLTYVQAGSLKTLFEDGLTWAHQYAGPNIFLSDGPKILAWPAVHRVITYGAEDFVTGRAVMFAPISVTSKKGLKEITIYNGRKLFRRFILKGKKSFNLTLVLNGSVQKDLVLIAEDVDGGKAVSFARRNWKDASSPVFCGDHVNDCGHMYLAHGPYWLPFYRLPSLPVSIAGYTWDGGPPATLPLIRHQSTVPVLQSDQGEENGRRFRQTPLLGFSDEGAVAVSSVKDQLYDKRVLKVVNPWNTYGPIDGASKLFQYTQRYRQYIRPTVGVPATGWAGPGIRVGISVSLFIDEISFRENLQVNSLKLGFFALKRSNFVISNGEGVKEYSQIPAHKKFKIKKGDWFGFYAKRLSNSNIFINRGDPFYLSRGAYLDIYADGLGKVKKGDKFNFAVFSLAFPVDVTVNKASDLSGMVDYLRNPQGLKILRGKRIDKSGGILEFTPENYAVEIAIPKPEKKMNLTLPVRIDGLNPRWSAGLWQKEGYVKGAYGKGANRYRALGMDVYGNAYVPVYVDLAESTGIVAGNPVIAGKKGKDLFIQVTNVSRKPYRWHIAVNNPTKRIIKTTLSKVMDLPGINFQEKEIIIKPGENMVIQKAW